MEANRKRYQYQPGTSYINGNTARKREIEGQYPMDYKASLDRQRRQAALPERQVPTPQRQVPTPQRQPYRQPRQLSGISMTSLFVLTIAIVATLYFSIEFLMLQHQLNTSEKEIISMERNYSSMINENNAAYEQINMVYDLDYVYTVAVSELGMVYPNNNEVILFESTKESYSKQYADIPK